MTMGGLQMRNATDELCRSSQDSQDDACIFIVYGGSHQIVSERRHRSKARTDQSCYLPLLCCWACDTVWIEMGWAAYLNRCEKRSAKGSI